MRSFECELPPIEKFLSLGGKKGAPVYIVCIAGRVRFLGCLFSWRWRDMADTEPSRSWANNYSPLALGGLRMALGRDRATGCGRRDQSAYIQR